MGRLHKEPGKAVFDHAASYITTTCTHVQTSCVHYPQSLLRLPYRPRLATLHGVNSQVEEYVSYWDFIDNLHRDSMLFYNFKYQSREDMVREG